MLKRPGQKNAVLLWDLFQYIKGCSLLLCNIHILGHCSKNKMEVRSSLPSFKSVAFTAVLYATFPWRKHFSGSGCLLYVWGEHCRDVDGVRPSAHILESTCVTTGSLSSQRCSFHIEWSSFICFVFRCLIDEDQETSLAWLSHHGLWKCVCKGVMFFRGSNESPLCILQE